MTYSLARVKNIYIHIYIHTHTNISHNSSFASEEGRKRTILITGGNSGKKGFEIHAVRGG